MKRILVVGAGKLQVNTIKLVKQLGYYCIAVDGNPNAEGFEYCDEYKNIDVLDIKSCVEYAKNKKIDGVTTTSATITLPAVSAIAEELGLIGINKQVVDVLRDKYKIKEILYNSGLNTYGYFSNISTKELYDKAKKNIIYPSVIKPSDGSGSKGISVVYREEDLEKSIRYAMESSRTKDIYIESFIEGEEYGVESFVINGEVIIYGVIKQTFKQKNGKIEYGHCLPSGLPKKIENIIKEEVKRAIIALGIDFGSVNMDIILSNDNKPYIIDVGARVGLNKIAEKIIPYATGVDIFKNTIKACVGENVNMYPKYSKNVASRVIVPKQGKVKNIESFQDINSEKNILDVILTVCPGEDIQEYKTKADACGWVIATGDTIECAEMLANRINYKIVKKIHYVDID